MLGIGLGISKYFKIIGGGGNKPPFFNSEVVQRLKTRIIEFSNWYWFEDSKGVQTRDQKQGYCLLGDGTGDIDFTVALANTTFDYFNGTTTAQFTTDGSGKWVIPNGTKVNAITLTVTGDITQFYPCHESEGVTVSSAIDTGAIHATLNNFTPAVWDIDNRFDSRANDYGYTSQIECASAGVTSRVSDVAYGRWSVILNKGADVNSLSWFFISSTDDISTTDGYVLSLNSLENIRLINRNTGANIILFQTANSYINNLQDYKFWIYRDETGLFEVYIMGRTGYPIDNVDYESPDLTKMELVGTATDNIYKTSLYDTFNNQAGDKAKELRTNDQYIEMSEFTDTTGTYYKTIQPLKVDKSGTTLKEDVNGLIPVQWGRVKLNALAVNSNCLESSGTNEVIQYTDAAYSAITDVEIRYFDGSNWINLSDTVSGGTSVTGLWRLNGTTFELFSDGVNFFSGKISYLICTDVSGNELINDTLAVGGDISTSYNRVITYSDGTLNNFSLPSNRTTDDGAKPSNHIDGFDLWDKAGTKAYIPFDTNGNSILTDGDTLTGYTWVSRNPSVTGLNNSETGIENQPTPALFNADSNNFWLTTLAASITKYFSDFTGNNNPVFNKNNSATKKSEITTYNGTQSGSTLARILAWFGL